VAESRVPGGFAGAEVASEEPACARNVERLDGGPSSESDVMHAAGGRVEVDDPDRAAGFVLDPSREGVGGPGADDPQRVVLPQKPDGRLARRAVDDRRQVREQRAGEKLVELD